MKRIGWWILFALSCGCSSKLTPPQVCEAVCRKLTSCPGSNPNDYQACVSGFQCAEQTDEANAACEQACLSKPSCSWDYTECRNHCVFPNACASSCASCASDEVCFGGTIPNSSLITYSATCRKRCASDDDCMSGEKCVQDVSTSGQLAGPVCLPTGITRCDQSSIGSCEAPSVCRDADTLQQVYFDEPSICGVELIHCPNGCDGPSADGGIPDGGMEARCR